MRADLEIISEWIQPGTRVLDLGCGDGTLLEHLSNSRDVTGYGLEIDDDNIIRCIERGVQVIKTDLDAGLADFFDEDSFDYVVMTQTLQAVRYPADLLDDMLRVGREGIVTFPNIGHWQSRLHLGLSGRMPITRALPSEWYDTANIHLCSLRDFEGLCRQRKIEILQRTVVDYAHRTSWGARLLPNLLGEIALYRFCRRRN
ncbi:MAG TPA: methionine biosynthesis protein MetW [Gammaproteobacteria bacterium]|jgi:methionine biosynthesis protein MetW|nr:methionine biosynthesis protein MetW [Gammaproteobacteria bacterium]